MKRERERIISFVEIHQPKVKFQIIINKKAHQPKVEMQEKKTPKIEIF